MGKLWTFPVTLIGLIIGVIGFFKGTKISIKHNAICFEMYPWGRPGSAITLGNCIICTDLLIHKAHPYSDDINVFFTLGAHEEEHTYQYERLGIFFIPVWLLYGGASEFNPLELEADIKAAKKAT